MFRIVKPSAANAQSVRARFADGKADPSVVLIALNLHDPEPNVLLKAFTKCPEGYKFPVACAT